MHKNPGNRWMSILAMLAVAALVGTVALLGPGGPGPAHAQNNAAPTITSLEFTSSPASGDAYLFGETIQVTVTFDQPVNVHESHDGVVEPGERELEAALGMEIGNSFVELEYTSGSGTDTLVFEFLLNAENYVDYDGVSIPPNTRPRDHWTPRIPDLFTSVSSDTPIDDLHDGIADSPGHKVLGRPSIRRNHGFISTPESGDTYGIGENIEMKLSYTWPVEVEGDKFLSLRIGTDRREFAYNRGSGTQTLVFRYTVQPGDFDDDGISSGEWVREEGTIYGMPYSMTVGEAYGYSGSGTIKAVGTDLEAMPKGPFQPDTPTHKVDGVAPAISSLSITSDAGDDNTFGVGDTIEVVVDFDEEVMVEGTPEITLDFDGTAKTATYRVPSDAGPTTRLIFTYTVRVGDMDGDGIAVSADALALNDGSIQDAVGNDANLSHDALSSNAELMVSAPGGL